MDDLKGLLQRIVEALVDYPDEVEVNEIKGQRNNIYEIRVAPGEVGRVIGKQGALARSIRTIMSGAAAKQGRRATIEILD
jgi:predicted RNA-binding protein YlqC (UPF0109 family)